MERKANSVQLVLNSSLDLEPHVDETRTEKANGTNSGESGVRNLEAECITIRSRAVSTGGCVKFKTVTEIIWRTAHDTFTAKSVQLVLNSLYLCWICSPVLHPINQYSNNRMNLLTL